MEDSQSTTSHVWTQTNRFSAYKTFWRSSSNTKNTMIRVGGWTIVYLGSLGTRKKNILRDLLPICRCNSNNSQIMIIFLKVGQARCGHHSLLTILCNYQIGQACHGNHFTAMTLSRKAMFLQGGARTMVGTQRKNDHLCRITQEMVGASLVALSLNDSSAFEHNDL